MFLTTLVHKLDSFLEHRMAVNLRLSLVVALLFHCPMPRIRRLLSAPSSAASSASPSVMSTLAGVWKAGRRRQLRLPSSSTRLAACKQRMAQLTTQAQQASTTHGAVVSMMNAYPSTGVVAAESLDVETFLQAWLVLEGTVLEVAAISENAQQIRRMEVVAKAATAAAQGKGKREMMHPCLSSIDMIQVEQSMTLVRCFLSVRLSVLHRAQDSDVSCATPTRPHRHHHRRPPHPLCCRCS